MNIKTLLLAAYLTTSAAVVTVANAATEMLDQVVAIIDDDIIMASELRERLAGIKESIASRGAESPPEDVLIRETLDRLILESIQLQMGVKVGVRISDAQLDAAVERIAAQNKMSIDQFLMALEKEGGSYQAMREQVRREMIIQRVQQGNVNQRIEITEQEVDNFLATQEGAKMTQPEYQILHALLAISPNASSSEVTKAQVIVDRVMANIRKGASFEQAIGATGPATFSGGDLGWRKLDDLPSLFSELAPGLSKGQTADPVRSDSGFHLIHMADRRGADAIMVSQTNVRHILIKPTEIMTNEQAKALATELRDRARSGEDFADLAREYSQDIGSAQEGGDLGWTSAGKMVPEFEKTMDNTKAGAISEPVRSQFGWHVLEVIERREQDMSAQANRNKAMNYLHGRKYQEELDAWLRQIRDEAFVDIK